MYTIIFTRPLLCMTFSCCDKSAFCTYLVDWDRTLEGYVLARNGSTEVHPLEAIVEGRMIAFATSLVLVARRISFKKGRSPLGCTFFYLVKYSVSKLLHKKLTRIQALPNHIYN